MSIEKDKVVTMHYHLTNSEGEVLDSSRGSDPLTYLHGVGNLVAGLERELDGLEAGATKTVGVEPTDGYGERDDNMMETLPRSDLDGVENLEVGMQLEAQDPNGQSFTVYVAEIRDDEVVIDANHPLAGVFLNFEIEIVDVRDATDEELSHGHVHGEGGHHH